MLIFHFFKKNYNVPKKFPLDLEYHFLNTGNSLKSHRHGQFMMCCCFSQTSNVCIYRMDFIPLYPLPPCLICLPPPTETP